MKKPLTFLIVPVSMISLSLAHDNENGYSFSVVEATEESKAAYLVLGMTVLIALTSLYFIYAILRDEWRDKK